MQQHKGAQCRRGRPAAVVPCVTSRDKYQLSQLTVRAVHYSPGSGTRAPTALSQVLSQLSSSTAHSSCRALQSWLRLLSTHGSKPGSVSTQFFHRPQFLPYITVLAPAPEHPRLSARFCLNSVLPQLTVRAVHYSPSSGTQAPTALSQHGCLFLWNWGLFAPATPYPFVAHSRVSHVLGVLFTLVLHSYGTETVTQLL
ncbi:hypothetical protein J6590_007782 [Homalodisca vitripennis]|nr:hypothetical protein J6590_007782 [Homalodisca vitripennis]